MNGAQSTWFCGWQVPSPSQVPGVSATLPVHDGERQVVSAEYTAQEPKPSQTPVVPQVERSWVAHRGSVVPRPSGRHWPAKPV